MESNIQNQPQQSKPTGAATARATSDGGQTVTDIVSEAAHAVRKHAEAVADNVSDAAHAVREHVEERGAEVISQAKQKVSEVYNQANKNVGEQYEKAVDYGRENPGITTLLAFGVGVGVGLLLVSGFNTLRSRVLS